VRVFEDPEYRLLSDQLTIDLKADPDLRPDTGFGALPPFGFVGFPGRPLAGLLAALERFFMSPPRLRTWHRSG
jgi:hypothetical protein